MFCMPITLCLLKCITETMQVTYFRKYLPQGPHSDSARTTVRDSVM